MQMEMGTPVSEARSIDAALDRLRRDLFDTPPLETLEGPEAPEVPDPIDYASLEFEVERMRKRLAIWEIFMAHACGPASWPEVQQSLTKMTSTRSSPSATASPCGTSSWTCGRSPGRATRTHSFVGAWPSSVSAALGDGQAPGNTGVDRLAEQRHRCSWRRPSVSRRRWRDDLERARSCFSATHAGAVYRHKRLSSCANRTCP